MKRWERLDGVLDVGALRKRRVLVVGLGSGGSTVALELAKAGVGRLTLIDPDRIEPANVIRHECDDRTLGRNKADAVAGLIRWRNPQAEVRAIARNAFDMEDALEREVRDADLVAACTDGEAPKHLLNRLCLGAGVTAVYGGVYERGVGGEIVRCAPGDACYACVTSVLKESAPAPTGADLDYGAVDADGRVHGAPGLGLDVRLIALIHAKVCLSALLGDGVPALAGNVVLFGTAAVEGLFPRPFASAAVSIGPRDDCLACAPFRRGFDLRPPGPCAS